MTTHYTLDLDAYLQRIAYTGSLQPTLATLQALHLAHVSHIPFENIDIQLGRQILLDLPHLEAKLVHAKRGGYCFEQNTFFAAVLQQLGFDVALLAARVRRNVPHGSVRPRTHLVIAVALEDGQWLADVGFSGEGLLYPIKIDACTMEQFAWTYRLTQQGAPQGGWLLQHWQSAQWIDFYAFTFEPQLPIDCVMASYYVSTHPQSRFVQTLTAQRATPEAHYMLIDRELTIDTGIAPPEQKTAPDHATLVRWLADYFDLRFPEGVRFPVKQPWSQTKEVP